MAYRSLASQNSFTSLSLSGLLCAVGILLVPGLGLGGVYEESHRVSPGIGSLMVRMLTPKSVAIRRTLSGHRVSAAQECGRRGSRAHLGKGPVFIAHRSHLSPSQPPPLTSCSCPLVLLREEVLQLQEEVLLLRQMKEVLAKDLEESQGGKCSEALSATELRVQLVQKEQELARAKEALQGE